MNAPVQNLQTRQGTYSPTQALAEFACALRYDALPPAVLAEARRALVDYQGCALAGSNDAVARKVRAVYAARSGAAESRLVGQAARADVLTAALCNGAAGHALDFDDTHADFFLHATVPVAPAAWAVGEMLHASGRELLAAFVAGWDVAARIARALYPAIYTKGWQGTATIGTFGAAAAAGRLLGLGPEAMRHALGLAAAQAGGTRQMLGTMSKPFQVGKAAMNGVAAALLAQEGVTSTLVGLEAPLGFAALTSPAYDLARTTEGLGQRFELLRNGFKPYPCCLKHHATVDAFLALRREHGITPERLASATVQVYPAVLDSANVAEPRTDAEGKFSVQHSAAVALADDAAGLPQYTTARVNDPALVPLRARLIFVPDTQMGTGQCRVTATCTDGSTTNMQVDHPLGSLERPLDDAELDRKFCGCTQDLLDPASQARLLAALRGLDAVADVDSVFA